MKKWAQAGLLTLIVSSAHGLDLTSDDIQDHQFMSKAHEFKGFGCDGKNTSPQLSWAGAPKGTKSYAITAYDPDAPTGSGWWHWLAYNIPQTVNELPANAGDVEKPRLPKGASQGKNDYGQTGFGGACPPPAHGVHHYEFKLYALKVKSLDIPQGASAALIGYMLNANAIETATLTSLYQR